jgi:tetratricopeptide (TPR) repeat protein
MHIGIITYLNPETLDEGVRLFEDARKISRETEDKAIETWSLRKLCEHYKAVGDFQKAKELLPRSIELMEEIRDPFSLVVRYLLGGTIHAELGEYDTALNYAKKGLEMGQKYEFDPVSWLLNTIGWIYYQIGDYSQAIEYCNRCLEFARQREQTMAAGGVPYSLSVLGMIYFDMKDFETAEKFNREALSVVHLHGGRPGGFSRLGSRIKMQLTELKLVKGQYEHALKDIDEIIDIFQGARVKKYIAHSLRIKGKILAKSNRIEEALQIMNEALNLAKEMESPFLMWRIHGSFGDIYADEGNYEKSITHYNAVKTLIEETASKIKDTSVAEILLTSSEYQDIQNILTKNTMYRQLE